MELTSPPRTIDELERDVAEGSNPLAYIPYAEALRVEGHLAKAIEICHRGLARSPRTAAGHILLARIHFDMGKYDLARGECDTVLQTAPGSLSARKLLAQISIKRRRYSEALHLVEELRYEIGEDPEIVSAIVEIQRGLAERFMRDLALQPAALPDGVKPKAISTENLLERIGERPEAESCEIIAPSGSESDWGQMLAAWGELSDHCGGKSISLSLLETPSGSVFIRDLGPETGTLVVRLRQGRSFGVIKHLAESAAFARNGSTGHIPTEENH